MKRARKSMTPEPRLEDLRLAIVGGGRVGTSFAAALRRSGLAVEGPLGRDSTGEGADVVLLCVPDRAIRDAAALIAPGPLVGHTSGATPIDVLAPRERFLLHPLRSIAGPETPLAGAYAAVAGSSDRALGVARALARHLGFTAFQVSEEERPLYHAAASLAANALVALLWDAERVAASAGLPRDALFPLAQGALESWRTHGAPAALTGPIARGDEATVERQRRALTRRHPELIPLWDALVERMRELASARTAP